MRFPTRKSVRMLLQNGSSVTYTKRVMFAISSIDRLSEPSDVERARETRERENHARSYRVLYRRGGVVART